MLKHGQEDSVDLFCCAEAASFHSPFSVQTRGSVTGEVTLSSVVWTTVTRYWPIFLKIRRDMIEKVELRRLSYFGHVARMDQNRVVREWMQKKRKTKEKVDQLGEEGLQS